MQGELLTIIFNFYYQIFVPGTRDSSSIQNGMYIYLFPNSIEGSGYTNLSEYMINDLGLGTDELFAYFFATIASLITIIVLIILLFKLFKRIFNLIFKLFRLNS